VELGPCIWTRRHIGIYLGHVAAFEPRPIPEALREHAPDDIRWWTLEELAESTEEFAPRRLPALVRAIGRTGHPERPIDAGD
jgi:hypothetical protein